MSQGAVRYLFHVQLTCTNLRLFYLLYPYLIPMYRFMIGDHKLILKSVSALWYKEHATLHDLRGNFGKGTENKMLFIVYSSVTSFNVYRPHLIFIHLV